MQKNDFYENKVPLKEKIGKDIKITNSEKEIMDAFLNPPKEDIEYR